jgi:hypothetical protein
MATNVRDEQLTRRLPTSDEYLAQRLTPYPLATPDSGLLHTIEDARTYMLTLPKIRKLCAHWQHVRRLLLQEAGAAALTQQVQLALLQVTCSKLGISLRRKSSLASGNGPIKPLRVVQSSTEERANAPAAVKLTLLIKAQNRQAAFELPLGQNLIEQLALEASFRGLRIAHI